MADKVLVTRRLPGDAVADLKQEFEVTVNPHDRDLDYDELCGMAEGCSGVITMLSNRVDAAFMDCVDGLRVISNYAVGYNNIDIDAARERGIAVTNTPGVLTETTADLTWALLMSVARRVVEADRYTREGRFEGWAPELFLGEDILGKTLGIVGMGRIGTAVARRSQGFRMDLVYASRSRKEGVEQDLGARMLELDELMAQADYVSIHTPLTDSTRHLIDRRMISLMKESAFLINTSRGAVVDEEALAEALSEGGIAGAALDVYENEPELHPGLAELPNTVLLPHLGSASHATRRRMARIAVDNLRQVLKGMRPPHPVYIPEDKP